jgi:hypothetical protein
MIDWTDLLNAGHLPGAHPTHSRRIYGYFSYFDLKKSLRGGPLGGGD